VRNVSRKSWVTPKLLAPKVRWLKQREAASRLQYRFLFSSDYPFITPQRWLKDFETLDYFKPEVREKLWKLVRRNLGQFNPSNLQVSN
jgi:predicted TIM-barrel fold metal-dependent hydrolase